MIKRKHIEILEISLRVEVIRLVRVKAYTRIRNGRIQKVRSHYRRY